MRVVVFSTCVPAYTICLANYLAKYCELYLIVPKGCLGGLEKLVDCRVRLVMFHQPRGWSPEGLRMGLEVYRRIKVIDPHVVHVQVGNIWLIPFLKFLRSQTLITTIHDPALHEGEQRFVDEWTSRFMVRNSRHIIVHGNALRGDLARLYSCPFERISVLAHGELSIYEKLAENGEVKETRGRLLFFGRILAYKGLDVLIEAQPEINRNCPEAIIVIAGRGRFWERHCEWKILDRSKYDINNRFIPDSEVARFVRMASVVVLPYRSGTQSGVVPLAFGFGRPVVASRVGAIAEIVEDRETGILVEPGDAGALAEACSNLLRNDGLRQQMGLNAKKKANADLNWDEIARKTCEIYAGFC